MLAILLTPYFIVGNILGNLMILRPNPSFRSTATLDPRDHREAGGLSVRTNPISVKLEELVAL